MNYTLWSIKYKVIPILINLVLSILSIIEEKKMSGKASQPNPINTRNVMHNTKSLNFSRTSLSVLSGVVAGILGLTSIYGFLFYIITSGLLGLYYLLSEARSDATHFLNKQQLVTGFVAENLFTYILVWTLVYGCVHVYWEMHSMLSTILLSNWRRTPFKPRLAS